MKVKDLIKELEKMPEDYEVCYNDNDNGWMHVCEVECGSFLKSFYHPQYGKTEPIVALWSDGC